MVWVKIDDRFDEHPKHQEVGPLAWGMWLAGLAYCNRNLTNGFIPWAKAHSLCSFEVADLGKDDGKVWTLARTSGVQGDDIDADWVIDLLVYAKLWEPVVNGTGRVKGFLVHDYGDYNPLREAVEADREEAKKRMREVRAKGGKGSGELQANRGRSSINPEPEPEPEPVPVPESEPLNDSSAATNFNDDMTKFNLSDPVDVWAMHSGRELTEKQKATVVSWVDTEGKPGVVELVNQAWTMKGAGDPIATDPFGYIKAVVLARRSDRVEAAGADLKHRRQALVEEDEEAELRYRRAVGVWAQRGKIEGEDTFSRERPQSVIDYLAKYEGRTDDEDYGDGDIE